MTDARLQELYERALAAREGNARERCASPEAILSLVRQEGSEDTRLETLDHVMSCEACSREFELLRSIELAGAESVRADITVDSAATVKQSPRVIAQIGPEDAQIFDRNRMLWRRVVPLVMAASVLLALGVGVVNRVGREETDVFRGEAEEVTLIAPPDEVAFGAPISFAWRPVAEARRYELEVLNMEGELMFTTTTQDTTATLPDIRLLKPDTDYQWLVRANSIGGTQRASPPRRLRITAR